MSPQVTPAGQPTPMQPGEFKGASMAQITSFTIKGVTPPSNIYIQQDDQIGILASCFSALEVVTINYRFLRAHDGVVIPGTVTIPITNSFTTIPAQFSLGEGYLLSLAASCNFAVIPGQLFVSAFICRGKFSASPIVNGFETLFAGYVTKNQAQGWPGGTTRNSIEGPGLLTVISTGQPAAGAEVNYLQPAGMYRRYLSAQLTLSCSATVANRTPSFICGAPTLGMQQTIAAPTAITASQSKTFFLLHGVTPYTDVNGNFVMPFPEPASCFGNQVAFQTATPGLQAGDQWSLSVLNCEQWLLL